MPTKNPRFTVALPESLLKAVTEYQHIHRLPTQNRAINELLAKGMDMAEAEISQECETSGLPPMLLKYNALDAHGRRVVDLVLNEEYSRCTADAPIASPSEMNAIADRLDAIEDAILKSDGTAPNAG